MKRKKIKESLCELERLIAMLGKLQGNACKIDAAKDLYKASSNLDFTLPVDLIREKAKTVFTVLSNTWCSTHASHSAGLLLEQRLVKKPKRGGFGRHQHCFAVDKPLRPVFVAIAIIGFAKMAGLGVSTRGNSGTKWVRTINYSGVISVD